MFEGTDSVFNILTNLLEFRIDRCKIPTVMTETLIKCNISMFT